jgi:hypothetical protein
VSTTAGGPRFEVRFDELALAEDLEHASAAGRRAGDRARREIERDGLTPARLMRCQEEGRDGTRLGGCVKTRVPWPDGRWGIVLVPIATPTGKLALRALAFGERHPTAPWRPSIYQVAHRRLHAA